MFKYPKDGEFYGKCTFRVTEIQVPNVRGEELDRILEKLPESLDREAIKKEVESWGAEGGNETNHRRTAKGTRKAKKRKKNPAPYKTTKTTGKAGHK